MCRWDLDKTYLRSDFETVRQLVRTAMERGEDKVEVPGVVEVVKGLKAAADRHGREIRTYFLSASPPQIGKAIRDKLALDGVPYDGITFKDQMRHLRSGRLRNLREHVGYKLGELIRSRLGGPRGARELLFGDDWESDALVYALYAELAAGRLPAAELSPLLHRVGVDPEIAQEIIAQASLLAPEDAVARVFINLERRSPLSTFRPYGVLVVPTFNYFQTALVLAAAGYLDAEDVADVGAALAHRAGYSPRRLENSLGDVVRRGVIDAGAAARLAPPLQSLGLLPATRRVGPFWQRLRRRARAGRWGRVSPGGAGPGAPRPIDFAAVLEGRRPARASDAREARG